jgi:3-oxoacyl-[acyl-carrier-protein] synthase II
MNRVVVTGLGAITPIGNTVADFSRALYAGIAGAAPITRFDVARYKTRFACEVKAFDAGLYMDATEMRKLDIYAQYALAAADQAMQQAMQGQLVSNPWRSGVIIGAANGGGTTYEQQIAVNATGDGSPRFNPFFISMMMANAATGYISIRYGLRGMNYASIAACAASGIAIIDAFNQLRWGRADMMLAGGSEAPITPACMGGFQSMKALSTQNDTPQTACRPFDTLRDGFVVGEGAVMFVLETEAHALARGATILAEICGAGITSDAWHIAAPHPQGEGAAAAMQSALADAKLSPTDIDYLSAHATATPVGDLAEAAAIRSVFGDAPPQLAISAVKAATGHLLGGAGAVGLLAAIEALRTQMVPPTINTTQIDPAIPATLPIVTGRAKPHPIRTAMCNSFGFGGHNAIIIVKRYEV